jgi:hypothetical protein
MDALVKALNSFCGTLEDRARRHRSGFRACSPGAIYDAREKPQMAAVN